ncbi:MAG: LuxR C-terminal-related transcriptional regulator [Rikenellaceae bacterium]
MSHRRVNIIVAEPSLIIRSGIVSVLLNIDTIGVDVAEVSDITRLKDMVDELNPDVVIVNPQYLGVSNSVSRLRVDGQKVIALCSVLLNNDLLRSYDAVISIIDGLEIIENVISKLVIGERGDIVELTLREKEVVSLVAKGASNKDIADVMNISTHTVTTHRRNIASKLKIHNSSGLTIYALVNGLVDMSEIR